jgi:hypothetical protein
MVLDMCGVLNNTIINEELHSHNSNNLCEM